MPFTRITRRIMAGLVVTPLMSMALGPLDANAAGAGAAAPSANAKQGASPGRFTGLGFDTCQAPDQATMDELRRESPFWGVGIYIGGQERSCSQPNLSRTWVTKQRARGWKMMPIWAGRQATCSTQPFATDISSDIERAERQGVASAKDAADRARDLGLAKGSTLFLDIEDYDNTDSDCNRPVLNYESGWNKTLKRLGYKGGLYSAAASGINMIGYIKQNFPDVYTLPSAIWIGHADNVPSTHSRFISDKYWARQRLKQYEIDVMKTYGSATLRLDINVIDIGGGSTVPRPRHTCGVRVDFPRYRVLHRGSRGGQVEAAQCLLKQHGYYQGKVSGRYTAATVRGVKRLQERIGVAVRGTVGSGTWTALHTAGSTPLLKRGSASDRVRELQRGLTAALGHKVEVSGYFSNATTKAVVAYQRNVGLDADGVVGPSTWKALKHAEH